MKWRLRKCFRYPDLDVSDQDVSPRDFLDRSFRPLTFWTWALNPWRFGPGRFALWHFGPGRFAPWLFVPGSFAPWRFGPGRFAIRKFRPRNFRTLTFRSRSFRTKSFRTLTYLVKDVSPPAFLDQDVSPLNSLDPDVLPPEILDQDVLPSNILDLDVSLLDVSDQDVSPHFGAGHFASWLLFYYTKYMFQLKVPSFRRIYIKFWLTMLHNPCDIITFRQGLCDITWSDINTQATLWRYIINQLLWVYDDVLLTQNLVPNMKVSLHQRPPRYSRNISTKLCIDISKVKPTRSVISIFHQKIT